MRRLSLSELKEKQLELEKKIAAAEEREKITIGEYMQELTGEYELENVKKWISKNIISSKKEVEVEDNERNSLRREASLVV